LLSDFDLMRLDDRDAHVLLYKLNVL